MEQSGIVFNIQKFSIHDGPGIRTTVFLKGCPLRCAWCSNPESQSGKPELMYDAQKCLRCGLCAAACKSGAVSLDDRVLTKKEKCIGCLSCVKACPAGALTSSGEERTVSEVFDICMQDEAYYEESGGGVTVSGGEGMAQPEFTEALAKRFRERGIHTAIETTGAVATGVFRRLAVLFDLLLFDIKHFNTESHKIGTGIGNELIAENLLWACAQGMDILPRIPVIPGFNDSLETAAGIARLLKKAGLRRVQLLPFHQMGEKKYEFLSREYSFHGVKTLHAEDLDEYLKIFLDSGLNCFI